jgi:hypothetical protein
MQPSLTPPDLATFQKYGVNVQGVTDVIWQPLYDHLSYPAAGTSSLEFFQVQKGQGATTAPGASGAKSLNDTNMTLGGQLPQPQSHLTLGISFRLYPGVAPGEGAVTNANAGRFVNDVWNVFKAGAVEFIVGEKPRVQEAPLGKMGSQVSLGGFAAMSDQTTAAATLFSQVDYAYIRSPIYRIAASAIPWGQNFIVRVTYPALVTLPSAAAMRIGCDLHGWLARAAQ